MRISTSVIPPPAARDTREQSPLTAQGAAKNTDPAVSSASVVKLSSAGTAASAEAAPAAGPTTTSRLQTIRAMLDKGAYPVDLDALASRIVDDELVRAGRS